VRPLALELFAGEGGATRGLMAAGFNVVAVDIKTTVRQYNPARHVVAGRDWRTAATAYRDLVNFDLVWASPPCQRYSHGTVAGHAHKHPDLIGEVRDYLLDWGVPFVLENVERAPLRHDAVLCGASFGLTANDGERDLYLRRHRIFEAHGFELWNPPRCSCRDYEARGYVCGGVYGGARSDYDEARNVRKGGYVPKDRRVREQLLGLPPDAMTLKGMDECIPPVFATWIAEQFLASREAVA